MPRTLGLHHPLIAAARELLTKKGRDAQERFLLEGPTLLEEALAAGVAIESVFVTETAWTRFAVCEHIEADRISVIPEAAFAKLSALERGTGIVAVARQRSTALEAACAHPELLILAGLNDPGNVGTLLRSAAAFGVRGVVMLGDGVELYNPKIVRAAMGALFRLDCARASGAELADRLAGRSIVGADTDGESLDAFVFPPLAAVMIGHERHGLEHGGLRPTHLVGIPQDRRTESLNAGVAGSILMYAKAKQTRLSSLG